MTDSQPTGPETRLHAIAGRWNTAGYVIGEPCVTIIGTDDYEILEGGYFVVHHVDVTVGEQAVRAIEIIGEPASDGDGYVARSFDSDGNFEVMHVTVLDDGALRFSGGPDIAPLARRPSDAPVGHVRSTLRVDDDGRSMTAAWERSDDAQEWHPWMDVTFTRQDETRPPRHT